MTLKNRRDPAKVHWLVELQQIVREVSSVPDLSEALCLIVKRLRKAKHTDVCSIYLLDPVPGTLVLAATEGLNSAAAGQLHLDSGEGLAGLVFHVRKLSICSTPFFIRVSG